MNQDTLNEWLASLPERQDGLTYIKILTKAGKLEWTEARQGVVSIAGKGSPYMKKTKKPTTIEELCDDLRKRPRFPAINDEPKELDFNERDPFGDYEDNEPDYDDQ